MTDQLLQEVLAPHDGSLALVRELNGQWFIILETGQLYLLPGPDTASDLKAGLGHLKFGTICAVDAEWRLVRAPALKEHQRQWVERVLGEDGARVIEWLIAES